MSDHTAVRFRVVPCEHVESDVQLHILLPPPHQTSICRCQGAASPGSYITPGTKCPANPIDQGFCLPHRLGPKPKQPLLVLAALTDACESRARP